MKEMTDASRPNLRGGKGRRVARLATVAVAVCALTSLPWPATASVEVSPADAQETAELVLATLDSSSDPQAAYDSLPSAQREAFDDYYLPAEEVTTFTLTQVDGDGQVTPEARAAARTFDSVESAEAAVQQEAEMGILACYQGNGRITTVNNFGMGLFDTWVEGGWCGNGTSTTTARFIRSWATIGVIGWRDAGQTASGAMANSGVGRIFAQRHFIFGAGGVDITHNYPCARLVTIDSGSHMDSGCAAY